MHTRTLLIAVLLLLASLSAAAQQPESPRLSPDAPPEIGAWFWQSQVELAPEGYRKFIDLVAEHSPYTLLTTSQRIPREITEPEMHDLYKAGVAYAHQKGLRVALDLDIRLAREAFRKAYPEEMQEVLRIKEADVPETGAEITLAKIENSDHMTWGSKAAYVSLAGKLVSVYAYTRDKDGIDPASVQDITAECKAKEESSTRVVVSIPGGKDLAGRKVAAMATFTLFCADVFAPHLIEFQRSIYKMYADIPLDGAMKDEWGFPTGPGHVGNDFYVSKYRAEAYAKRTGGHNLLADCFLMFAEQRGKKSERQAAINHFQEMNWQRNSEIEEAFYRDAKETFGPAAFVGTHATWHPALNIPELNKNGWDWWAARRDYGQSDETTPYPARTSLARKWGGAVWYNQWYSTQKDIVSYTRELWKNAISGGRINYHPLFPHKSADPLGGAAALLEGGLMQGECRVRLLNFVTRAQLDCPVAIVFGHAAAMNWAGPAFMDNGVNLAQQFWNAGFPADLIPSSEIRSGAVSVTGDGFVQYGAAKHKYKALILHQPEFERPETAEFWKKAASGGKTALYRNGNWTADFDAKPFDGNALLRRENEEPASVQNVTEKLKAAGVEPSHEWNAKDLTGRCRLTDGTEIIVAASAEQPAGVVISKTLKIGRQEVTFECIGLAAVRFNAAGELQAIAAGALKSFKAAALSIELHQPADIALWRDEKGNWRGVLQGHKGEVPEPLLSITKDWLRLSVPKPVAPN